MTVDGKELKRIYITDKPHRAEIVVAVLEDHGITAYSIDKRDSSYLFGDIEVYADAEQETKALQLITENEL